MSAIDRVGSRRSESNNDARGSVRTHRSSGSRDRRRIAWPHRLRSGRRRLDRQAGRAESRDLTLRDQRRAGRARAARRSTSIGSSRVDGPSLLLKAEGRAYERLGRGTPTWSPSSRPSTSSPSRSAPTPTTPFLSRMRGFAQA